jgi:hypothetical protein
MGGGHHSKGKLLPLLANIRPGWKGETMTNALDYSVAASVIEKTLWGTTLRVSSYPCLQIIDQSGSERQ